MKDLNVKTSARSEMIDITTEIAKQIPSDMQAGICHVFCKHTTAGLTVNENADPDVRRDMLGCLDRIVPWNSPDYLHFEGNTAAHVKASMMGFSLTVPVCNGRLVLGTWQGIYFCEFDGPRSRSVVVQFIRST